MKLLLPVDSIRTLNILLDEMSARSWPTGTEARVLSIVEDAEVPLETWREEGYGPAAVRQEMRRRGEQITALALNRLRAIGIFAEVTIMRGNPIVLIPFAARKWSTDLILIRAHNRTDFRNWMLGSVAKSVVESAPCSVEVVRSIDEPRSVSDEHNFRVLLATDGSDASLAASQFVAQSNWPEDSEVRVVSVVNPVIYSLEEIGLSRGKGTERAHRAIGGAVQALKNAPLKVSGEVIAGSVARGIIDRAQNWRADLIVLGAHDRRGLKRLFRRSTSAAVANRAHCSVRIVRGHAVSQNEESSPRRASPSLKIASSVYNSIGLRRAA